MPERIQIHRTKGWRLPVGAIVVARPSGWGNPFTPAEAAWFGYAEPERACRWVVDAYRSWLEGNVWMRDVIVTGDRPYGRRWVLANLDQLAGHDLACWCALDRACHADVLLALANPAVEVLGA